MADPAHEYPTEHVDVTHITPVATPATTRRTTWAMLGVRIILTLVGAAGLIISAFLNWADDHAAVNISIRSLWSTRFADRGGTFIETVGFAMVVIGLLAVLGLAPVAGWLTRFAGVLGIAVFVLFLIEIYRDDRTVSALQAGPWVAVLGGVIALVGGFLGTRTVTAARPGYVEPA
jgi:hypothetical protein